jgi:hypothetical protein
MDGRASLDFVAESIRAAWQPPFRGEIYEYARKLDLQAGYAVRGAFDINTARHLIEPLQAIRNPRVRLVSITAAVQTLKSLIADLVVPYWIEHDPGDVLWLLEDDAKAKWYAETRAMPLIKSIPEIAAMLRDVDRHDKTKTKIIFRHMNLVFAGLNPGNVQSISYRYVIIDEKWMAKSNGLIRQGKDRTKQYPHTKKIILLGQGGLEDDDADIEHKETDQRELEYACPSCGGRQPFELSRKRPEDFPIEKLRGTYAGLSWDTNEITRPNGRWNFEAVGRTAHHRCYFCDHRIEDTPDVRRQLNDSYGYKVTNPNAPADAVGFHWPGEASMRVPFAELAVKYLRAKVAHDELGYELPLQEYYQKDRGLAWNQLITGEHRTIVHEPYDARSEWKDEAFRVLIADCQKDLKKFHASVFAFSLAGETRELARETVSAFGAVTDPDRDSIAWLQKEWKVKDQHVFLDCGYQMTQVLRACVQHGHVGTVSFGGRKRKVWLCWTGLKGSGQDVFVHKHPKTGVKEARIYSERKFYDTNIGTAGRAPRSPYYEWSNLHCKDLLRARRDGDAGVPKFLTLPETAAPTDINSHFAQMRSEKRLEEFRNGRKRASWVLVKESRPNHEWDKAGMCMAVQAIFGIIGAPDGEPANDKTDHQH